MKRGFTLIEVIIALAIGAILLTTVMSVLTLTLKDNRRTRAHSEIMREAESVTRLMNQELRLAGLGVPAGANIDAAYGSSPPAGGVKFYASLLVGGNSEVGVLADLPRPDANYSTFGALHSRATGSAATRTIAWHNENNGTCMPDGAGTACVAGRDSIFFADNAAGCTATGSGAPFTDRKCPWGMRRLLANDAIQIAAGDGTWSNAVVSGAVQKPNTTVDVISAVLTSGYNTAIWPNLVAADGPAGRAGQGFVTTLDRVFYRLVGSTIVRQQCWGDPNPNDSDWPDAATNTVPTTPETTGGGGGTPAPVNSTCTVAEVVARNVSSFALRYFDASGVAVTVGSTTKDDVRRVDYTIGFAKTVDGRQVLHEVAGSIRLTNAIP